jgi:predicted nucleotidyltransferase
MPILSRPLSLLFGSYRSEVLAVLLLRPQESFHVRELARLTGVPAGSLHRELKVLHGAGVLIREPLGNQVRYRANLQFPLYAELAEIFRKTAGLADVLKEALKQVQESIDLAFVFGSMAQGRERAVSDVDVLVIGVASFADVVKAVAGTEPRLGREVNPVVMTKREFRRKLKEQDRFVTRVTAEPKLFLIGNEDDFRKLAQDGAA